ncbi:MAG: hypothetical protein AAGM38_12390, partial [Pseudomonadota bacterium]
QREMQIRRLAHQPRALPRRGEQRVGLRRRFGNRRVRVLHARPLSAVVDAFRARFETTVETVETAVEDVSFRPPRILREPARSA